jgi:hypothetical protein
VNVTKHEQTLFRMKNIQWEKTAFKREFVQLTYIAILYIVISDHTSVSSFSVLRVPFGNKE